MNRIYPYSKISYFPLTGYKKLSKDIKYIIVFKGEAFIYEKGFFDKEQPILVTTKEIKLKIPEIKIILTGKNTLITLTTQKPDMMTGQRGAILTFLYVYILFSGCSTLEYKNKKNFNYISSKVNQINPNTYTAEPQKNCATLFKDILLYDNYGKPPNTVTVCHKPGLRNSEFIVNSDNSIVRKGKKLNKNEMVVMHVFLAEDSTLVLYENVYINNRLESIATPIQNKVTIINSASSKYAKEYTLEGIVRNFNYFEFLDIGCFTIFNGTNYRYPILRHCCSLSDMTGINFQTETILKSILLGKKTIVTIYTQPNYQGSKFTLYSSIENYKYLSEEILTIGSIKVHESECTLNPMENLQGCYYIYTNPNRQGERKLVCQKTFELNDNSFKNKLNVDMLCYV